MTTVTKKDLDHGLVLCDMCIKIMRCFPEDPSFVDRLIDIASIRGGILLLQLGIDEYGVVGMTPDQVKESFVTLMLVLKERIDESKSTLWETIQAIPAEEHQDRLDRVMRLAADVDKQMGEANAD